MKRFLVLLFLFCALLLAAGLVGSLLLEKAAAAAVETAVPRVAGVPVSVGGVSLSLTTGRGELREVMLGNPEGFRSDYALKFATARFHLKLASLTEDKVVIDELVIESPEILYEARLGGSNLSAILSKVESQANRERDAGAGGGTRFEVRRLSARDGRVALIARHPGPLRRELTLTPLEIANIGAAGEGATLAGLLAQVIGSLNASALAAVAGSGSGIALESLGEGPSKRPDVPLEQLKRSPARASGD